MPAKMISETPFPTPRLVICSPIHISSMVPPVRVTMVERVKKGPGFTTRPGLAWRLAAMAAACTMASTTVR